MTERRRGLGRGLGALIPQGPLYAGPSPGHPAGHGPSGDGPDGPSPVDLLIPEPARAPAQIARDDAAQSRTDHNPDPHAERAADVVSPGGMSSPWPLIPAPATRPLPGSAADAYFAELPLAAIRTNPRQPRSVFDPESMDELVQSIREVGLLQPVVVREAAPGQFELVVGERRWRAARVAGLRHIPAIVRATDDDAMLRDALLENLHRSQLNPLEEAAAYDQLLADFGCTQEELASRLGRSRPQISNTLRLLRLPAAVQRRVAAGVLSAGHARALLTLEDPSLQERLAQRIVAEGLSVRTVEEITATGAVDGPSPARRASRAQQPAPMLADVAARLSDHLDTRVTVHLGRTRGRITVDFATVEDLERIAAVMGLPAGRADPGS